MLQVAKDQACMCFIIHMVLGQHSDQNKQSKEVQDPKKEEKNTQPQIWIFLILFF